MADYRRTGIAVPTALVLFVPGIIIGGILATIYELILKYFMITLTWLPFYELVETVVVYWFGGLLQGGIAAAVAVGGSLAMFKEANPQAVAYSTVAVWLTFMLVASMIGISALGFTLSLVEAVAFSVGIALGAFEVL